MTLSEMSMRILSVLWHVPCTSIDLWRLFVPAHGEQGPFLDSMEELSRNKLIEYFQGIFRLSLQGERYVHDLYSEKEVP